MATTLALPGASRLYTAAALPQRRATSVVPLQARRANLSVTCQGKTFRLIKEGGDLASDFELTLTDGEKPLLVGTANTTTFLACIALLS